MITRVPEWRASLLDWAASVRGMPFIWGRTDCVTLVRAALRVCFGQDVFPVIPAYHSETQALAVYRKHGGAGDALRGLGADRRMLSFARMGDIIAIPEPEEPLTQTALGVWCERFAVMSSRDGVLWVGREMIEEKRPEVYSLWAIDDLEAVRVR